MISNFCGSISRTKSGANVRSEMGEICAPNSASTFAFPFRLPPVKTGGGFSY